MRRRIWLSGWAVGVATLVVGVAGASAASAPTTKLVVRCASTITTTPPADSNSVPQPPTSGWQYGHAQCPKKGFKTAAEARSFSVLMNGNTVGSYRQYFSDGEIWGKYTLVPQDVNDFGMNFTAASWVGTFTVTGGSGAYQGIRSAKPGVMNCSSPDTVHLTCTEKIKVKAPASL